MIILLEGFFMCFLLLLVCVIGIANGPVHLVVLYEKDVQERVIQLGLITREKLRKNYILAALALFLPQIVLVPVMVYGFNGATGFSEPFAQMTMIFIIQGLFDRFFIDWYWVGHTKAWQIEGTEDLKPYIPRKISIGKWVSTLIIYPLCAALIAWIATFL